MINENKITLKEKKQITKLLDSSDPDNNELGRAIINVRNAGEIKHTQDMSYQKCPDMIYQKCAVCEGTGKSYSYLNMSTNTSCNPCKGTGLISVLNGLPPAEQLPFVEKMDEGYKAQLLKGGEQFWSTNTPINSSKEDKVRVDFITIKKSFYEIARFILTTRLNDPESTLDDIWNKWVNENNL